MIKSDSFAEGEMQARIMRLIFATIAIIVLIVIIKDVKEDQIQTKLDKAVEEQWALYVNGNAVSSSELPGEYSSITFDDRSKSVFVTVVAEPESATKAACPDSP